MTELGLEIAQGTIRKRKGRYVFVAEGEAAIGIGIEVERARLAKLVNRMVIAVVSNTRPRLVVAINGKWSG